MDQKRLEHIKELFREAEHRCKVVETRTEFFLDKQLVTGLLIPSINQLRYAGQHLLDYVTSEKESDLGEAEHHCKRAIYDAYQAEVLFYLRKFMTFQNEFSDLIISETISVYWDWTKQHEAAQGAIRESSASFSRSDLDAILVPHAEALNSIHVLLPKAREDLLKKRRAISRKRLFNIMLLSAAVFAAFVAALAWFMPDPLKSSSASDVDIERNTKALNNPGGVSQSPDLQRVLKK